MKNRELFQILTNQYLQNIGHLTENYTNALHLMYRESTFTDDEVIGIFGELERLSSRYASYFDDENKCFFHEEDILLEARKCKNNYDAYL